MKMFSATVSSPNRCGSWYTVAMPAAIASVVDENEKSFSSSAISPVSGNSAPARILIRVDFPAPFSPTRACTVPGRTSRSACRIARTAPKRFEIPLSLTRGVTSVTRSLQLEFSVVVVASVFGVEHGRRPEEQRFVRGGVLGRRDVVVHSVRVRKLVALAELKAGPRGQIAELLDVPQD